MADSAIDLRRRTVLTCALIVSGCAGPGAGLPPIGADAADPTDYVLGPGDQVRLIVYGEDNLTGEYRVDASGGIALPLVGTLHAAGLTPRGLERAAADALLRGRLLEHPSVSVEVVAYRPFFILGEVARPGEYPYQPDMTVVAAVAVAGGFTYRAVQGRFSIVRPGAGGAVEGRASRQTLVRPGDVVTVYERRF